MFSSPIMQTAERIFTVSVIMCGCFGSIALDSSKRLLSSPRILCKPYWEGKKHHGQNVVLALDQQQLQILRDSPNPSLPGGFGNTAKTLPKLHLNPRHRPVSPVLHLRLSPDRFSSSGGHQDLVKSVPTRRKIKFYFLSISEALQQYEKCAFLPLHQTSSSEKFF